MRISDWSSDVCSSDLNAEIDNREIGGQFYITADVKPGGDVERVEKIIGEELDKLLAEGPTKAEMARLRTSTVASFVRSLESISGKASLLAESQTYLGRNRQSVVEGKSVSVRVDLGGRRH